MSASQIPNLLSLRGSGRGGRGRARGGRGGHGPPSAAHSQDSTIQGTDTDAAVSRLSAVELGYLEDPFARFFVQDTPGPGARRLPIINRGTYTRTTALDAIVQRFISDDSAPTKQIISLGAGTDTRCFRLFAGSEPLPNIVYHEIDFPAICAKKFRTVQVAAPLRAAVPSPVLEADGSWHSRPAAGGEYWCHGADLRDLPGQEDAGFVKGLQTQVPTLLVSECCLCYLQTAEAAAVVGWFADRIPDLGIVLYEPVKPHDSFGQVMVSNLAARGIRMPTLEVFREPQDQDERLRAAGFDEVRHMTIDEVWKRWVAADEKERLDSLEGLDEVEEWDLLASHYIVAWGWRGKVNL